MPKMKAAVFIEPGRIRLEEKPVPDAGPLDALMRVSTTTICGTDIHIQRGAWIGGLYATTPIRFGVRRCGHSSGVPDPACG
jgi:threonine dehydrogenase-like Zn-dependent dehydrogenase